MAAFMPSLPLGAHTFRKLPLCGRAPRTARARATMAAATPATSTEKMLHAVYRVGDMQKTGQFLKALGMQCLRERDIPEEKYANAFYGYGTESKGQHFALELTYNYGVEAYELGNAFGNFQVTLPDVGAVTNRLEAAGFRPTPAGEGAIKVLDPTGYEFVVKQGLRRDPLAALMYHVSDVDNSIKFYTSIGMALDTHATNGVTLLSYGAAGDTTALELRPFAGAGYDAGEGYAQIAVSTPSVYAMADRLKGNDIKVTRDPGPVPGIGTKITAARDPDNLKVVFVDADDFEKEL